MPDGNIVYIHVITPVPGADYTILQMLYVAFTDPTEQKTSLRSVSRRVRRQPGRQLGTVSRSILSK